MKRRSLVGLLLVTPLFIACQSPPEIVQGEDILVEGADMASPPADLTGVTPPPDLTVVTPPPDLATSADCGTALQCAAQWEQNASNHYDSLLAQPTELAAFLKAVPKGGDLHNHLTGAVYAETVLGWASSDGNCINSTAFTTVAASQCSTTNLPVPTSGTFFDSILRAWSMYQFVPGTENGHDHFFATFGKFGSVAGLHRDQNLGDITQRAADENQLYIETMFNLGKNVGTIGTNVWTASTSTLTSSSLPGFHASILADPGFNTAITNDVNVVTSAVSGYRNALGCSGSAPPAACDVGVRFVAQVSRTGALDTLFGQLVSAYEMASRTDIIVAANLSSPEDDTTSLKNYALHMDMLDYLNQYYTVTQKSPLHVTLHAGELVPQYLPSGYATANTFHIRSAVETGHAERIGHGIDVMSETDPAGLVAEMKNLDVLVEVCLSSNDQILQVNGTNHPLGYYLQNGVPVALATDDQGVSRSSLAGEYLRAAQDQKLSYLQLKQLARNSLQYSFLPGAHLFNSVIGAQAVTECTPTDTMPLGATPSTTCQAFLDGSERARLQWTLEARFLDFESKQ